MATLLFWRNVKNTDTARTPKHNGDKHNGDRPLLSDSLAASQ